MIKSTPYVIKNLFAINYINRFARMKLNKDHTVAAHTSIVVILVSIFSLLENKRRTAKGLDLVNREIALDKACWHDIGEIFTGDIIAPIKEYNEDMVSIVGDIEAELVERHVIKNIDKSIKETIKENILNCKDGLEGKLVDCCDLLERLIHLLYEKLSGNQMIKEPFKITVHTINDRGYSDEFPEVRKLILFLQEEIS